MRFLATKDTHEREDEEAERLVRPSPKLKPPRRDLRRQTTDADRDSDTSGDPDLKGDPDLSLNYKNVGGSLAERIVYRFVEAKKRSKPGPAKDVTQFSRPGGKKPPAKKVKVFDTESERNVEVSEQTLKNEGSRYKRVSGPSDGDKPEKSGPPPQAERPEPAPVRQPDAPSEDDQPETVQPETVQPETVQPETVQPETVQPETVRPEPAGESGSDDQPDDEGAKSDQPPGDDKPGPARTPGTPDDEFLKSLPTSSVEDGKVVVWDDEAEARVPFDQASEATRKRVVERYEAKVRGDELADAFEGKKDKAAKSVLLDLAFVGGRSKGKGESEGALAKKLRDLQKSGDPLKAMSLDHVKNELALAGVTLPPSIKNLQQLVDAASAAATPSDDEDSEEAKSSKARAVVERFKAEKQGSPEFKEFAKKLPTVETDESGEPVFFDKNQKKAVPFDELPDDKQHALVQRFEQEQTLAKQRKFMQDNPGARKVLDNLRTLAEAKDTDKDTDTLGGPDYMVSIRRALADGDDIDELPVAKMLPDLKNLPDDVVTVSDLVRMAESVAVKPPKRKDYDEKSAKEVRVKTYGNLPTGSARQVVKLHPEDQEQIVEEFSRLKNGGPKEVGAALKEIGGIPDGFDPDNLDNLSPPEKITVDVDGKRKEVDFNTLPAERQTQEFQRYKVQLVALHVLSKEAEAEHHHLENGVPKTLAEAVVYNPDLSPAALFNESVKRDSDEPLPTSKQVKKMLKDMVFDDQKAQAVAYLQARDFQDVSQRYIRDGLITEHLPTNQILKLMEKADQELIDRESLYPEHMTVGAPSLFRNKILQHMTNLHAVGSLPDSKFKIVQDWVREHDALDYEHRLEVYEKQRRPSGGTLLKDDDDDDDDSEGSHTMRPPEKPEGYDDFTRDRSRSRYKPRKGLFGLFRRNKEASVRVAARHLSFCEATEAMSATNHQNRQAVYWGVEPYPKGEEGFAPYNEWEQAHVRDLDEPDLSALLKAAEGWLDQPILDLATMGEGVPDARYRAALDFAIQTTDNGKYAVALHPALYNELLARLAGKPVGETLVTIREASSPGVSLYNPRSMRTHAMTASTEIRKYAAKLASANPSIAFDLMGLADKVAQQEQQQGDEAAEQGGQQKKAQQGDDQQQGQGQKAQQKQAQQKQGEDEQADEQGPAKQQKQAYTALRSAVIRTAGANPVARQALGPVLRLIQQIG